MSEVEPDKNPLSWSNIVEYLNQQYVALFEQGLIEMWMRDDPLMLDCLKRQIQVAEQLAREPTLHWLKPMPHHCMFDLYTGTYDTVVSVELYGVYYRMTFFDKPGAPTVVECRDAGELIATIKAHPFHLM